MYQDKSPAVVNDKRHIGEIRELTAELRTKCCEAVLATGTRLQVIQRTSPKILLVVTVKPDGRRSYYHKVKESSLITRSTLVATNDDAV